MTLTKAQIVDQIVKQTGFTQAKSVELVENIIKLIKSSLSTGDDVLVSGFGKFCVQNKKPRRGRNPATGEDLMLDARKIVTFKCSANLRKAINGKR